MVRKMLSNRTRRVYDGYLKNSRFYMTSSAPPSTQRYHCCTRFLLGDEGLLRLWWWRLLTRLLWGLGEQHGGKHCKERQQLLTAAGVSSGCGDALLVQSPFYCPIQARFIMTNSPIIDVNTIKQQLQLNECHAQAFLSGFFEQLTESKQAIEQGWQTVTIATTVAAQQTALTTLERAAHKLKGSTCFGHVPTLNRHCSEFVLLLRQHQQETALFALADHEQLPKAYQKLIEAITAVLTAQAPGLNLSDFLTQWDSDYQAKVEQLPLFHIEVTSRWRDEQKRQFAQLFYHARGHFYKFLWLLGNEAPNSTAKETILDNIREEFGGDGLSHEAMYDVFANAVGVDVNNEFFHEPHHHPYLQQYNLGHLNWLNARDWQGKLAGFSAYERLDNIDYHHLENLVKSLGITGKGLTFFKVHNKADHFDRLHEQLVTVWDNSRHQVEEAFDFIARHQLTMWQWLSHTLCE
ncbi:MAG: iron-containing redox enzyme family protein [Gammaproteobacteria bacterium]|nr:iron-containing redox enzyme family protein [Gammaproteobacteria bacterium]